MRVRRKRRKSIKRRIKKRRRRRSIRKTRSRKKILKIRKKRGDLLLLKNQESLIREGINHQTSLQKGISSNTKLLIRILISLKYTHLKRSLENLLNSR